MKYAIELPPETKRRLGLDGQPSWVKTDNLNVFTWPGPDVRPVGRGQGFAYGFLPKAMMVDVLDGIRQSIRDGRAKAVNRDVAVKAEE